MVTICPLTKELRFPSDWERMQLCNFPSTPTACRKYCILCFPSDKIAKKEVAMYYIACSRSWQSAESLHNQQNNPPTKKKFPDAQSGMGPLDNAVSSVQALVGNKACKIESEGSYT